MKVMRKYFFQSTYHKHEQNGSGNVQNSLLKEAWRDVKQTSTKNMGLEQGNLLVYRFLIENNATMQSSAVSRALGTARR